MKGSFFCSWDHFIKNLCLFIRIFMDAHLTDEEIIYSIMKRFGFTVSVCVCFEPQLLWGASQKVVEQPWAAPGALSLISMGRFPMAWPETGLYTSQRIRLSTNFSLSFRHVSSLDNSCTLQSSCVSGNHVSPKTQLSFPASSLAFTWCITRSSVVPHIHTLTGFQPSTRLVRP